MTWEMDVPRVAVSTHIECREKFGTHGCGKLNGHVDLHMCVCWPDPKRWATGELAPLDAYNPKQITDAQVVDLIRRGLIGGKRG